MRTGSPTSPAGSWPTTTRKKVPIPEVPAPPATTRAWRRVHFPEGLGGLGVSRGLQAVADRILQGAGGPVPLGLNPMGYGMAAPTDARARPVRGT